MKNLIYIFLAASFFLLCQPLRAEDSIRILMLEDPKAPLPSEETENLGNINGKVFFDGEIYSGSLNVRRDENGLYIINDIPFEQYVEGVVASETGKAWELEAVKTQAVISRTYAVFHKNLNEKKEFHLTSSVLHQVFKGNNINPMVKMAVKETEGEILKYEGSPVQAFYHSICVGKTELPEEVWGGSFPYLQSVDCNSKNTPYDHWKRKFSFEEIGNVFGINKRITDMSIASHTSTGRVKTIRIATDMNPSLLEIKATDLRKFLGYKRLPSTDFSITNKESGITFEGRGWGHGVGLCQWGALEMAREGKDYREILAHYYPGTNLEKQISWNR